jgi:hypothetical protein
MGGYFAWVMISLACSAVLTIGTSRPAAPASSGLIIVSRRISGIRTIIGMSAPLAAAIILEMVLNSGFYLLKFSDYFQISSYFQNNFIRGL